MVGMAQAIALAKAGFEIDLFDHTHPKDILGKEFDGRTSAIAYKSYNFLDKIGAWEEMQKHGQPILDIRVSDSDSLLFTHFDHSEIGREAFGYIIENRFIRSALWNVAKNLKNINIILKSAEEVEFTDYELVVAADGKFSKAREKAGIAVSHKSYKQSGIVATIEHELPHEGLAVEKFLPQGPFAVLPMQGNKSSLVWTEPTELADIYMKMDDEDFLEQIQERINWLGEISLTDDRLRWCYPLTLSHAEKYVDEKFVLIGDAAHGIHPIAGQGVNLGYRDAIELTEIITENAKLGLPIGSVTALQRYEKLRRIDNTKMIWATDKLNILFSNNILPIKLARDIGLGLVNEIQPLKRWFMKQAAGKN